MSENIYEKRPRKKMVRDPVTGEVNVNAKQIKPKKKSTKVSGPDKFRDFRPLDQFESKLLGQKRLSVLSLVLRSDGSLIQTAKRDGVGVFPPSSLIICSQGP
jgi:hypothetical protein